MSPRPTEEEPGGGEADPDLLLEKRGFGKVEPLSPFRFHHVPRVFVSRQLVLLAVVSGLAVISAWIAMTYPLRPALAFFVALLGGIAVLAEPFLGVLAYYLMAFMRPQETFWGLGDTRLTLLVSLATLAAAALQFAVRPDFEFLKRRQNFFIAVLWLFIYLSTLYGDFGGPEPKWLDYYNKLFLIYFVMLALMTSERKLFWLAWILIVSIGYLGWWGNEMYFLHGWHVVHGPGRSGSAFYDENDFAMVLVMGVPFIWYMMRYTSNRLLKLALLAWIPLMAHGVMVTFSRGGFLGLAASMVLIAVREKNRKLGGAMIAVGLIFFVAVAGEEYKGRIGSIDNFEEDRSAAGRLESWEAGINMATRNPLFGVGLKRYVQAFPYYSNFEPRAAHNSWVQLGAECGLVALACYGFLIVFTMNALRRIRKRLPLLRGRAARISEMLSEMYLVSMVGYLVCGFFLSMEDFEFFYLLVGMVQILDRVTEARVRDALPGTEAGPASSAAAEAGAA